MISHVNRFESLLTEISREPSFFLCPTYVEFNLIRCLFLISETQYNMILQIWKSSKSAISIFHWYYSKITQIEFNQTNYQIKSSKHSTERNLSLHNSRNDKCKDKMWDFLMPRKRLKSSVLSFGNELLHQDNRLSAYPKTLQIYVHSRSTKYALTKILIKFRLSSWLK